MNKDKRFEDVSTETLRESLLALADLRRKYTGENQITAYAADPFDDGQEACPLCQFKKAHGRDTQYPCLGCTCPWVWIEGKPCDEGGYLDEGYEEAFARIDRWAAFIRSELAAREATHDDQTP